MKIKICQQAVVKIKVSPYHLFFNFICTTFLPTITTIIIIVLNLLFFAAFPSNKVSGHRRFHAQTGKEKDQNGFAANRRRLRKRREG